MDRRRGPSLLILLALAAALPRQGARAEGAVPIRAEFWIEMAAQPGEEGPLKAEEAARRLLDEASWVFAGMIWGFEFSYEPLDRGRAIAERFELKALGSIEPGDRRLAPDLARFASGLARAFVEYRPDEVQALRLGSYSRAPWVRSQGIGVADYARGWPGRREAYEDALRQAVRSHLRSVEPNKPRRSAGRVVIERVPTIVVQDGAYTVRLRARVEVVETLPYVVY